MDRPVRGRKVSCGQTSKKGKTELWRNKWEKTET